MEQVTYDNNLYCRSYIISELQKNVNLFAEFEINSSHTTCNFEGVLFRDGYILKNMNKTELLQNIREIVKSRFNNKYFITTRPKYDSSRYYIVLTLLQENSDTSLIYVSDTETVTTLPIATVTSLRPILPTRPPMSSSTADDKSLI